MTGETSDATKRTNSSSGHQEKNLIRKEIQTKARSLGLFSLMTSLPTDFRMVRGRWYTERLHGWRHISTILLNSVEHCFAFGYSYSSMWQWFVTRDSRSICVWLELAIVQVNHDMLAVQDIQRYWKLDTSYQVCKVSELGSPYSHWCDKAILPCEKKQSLRQKVYNRFWGLH